MIQHFHLLLDILSSGFHFDSYEEIKELKDTNDCVEHISEKYIEDDIYSLAEAKANAIHFCNGGVKDSLSKK